MLVLMSIQLIQSIMRRKFGQMHLDDDDDERDREVGSPRIRRAGNGSDSGGTRTIIVNEV